MASTEIGGGTFEVLGRRTECSWIGPGPAEAPTIVFLHEALGSVSTWRDFPGRLAEATGCGALLYSRAGHGRSGPLLVPRSDRYLHEEALEVLPAVLDRFSIREAVLLGHSDGASIAVIHAGARPAGVRGLILEAPHVLVEEAARAGIRRAIEAYGTTNLGVRLARHHGEKTDALFRTWADTWLRPSFQAWNIEEYLPAIRCPVLVVQGEDDAYGTLQQVDAILRQVAGPARSLVLPRCGHSPHSEQPENVLAAAARFVREAAGVGC
jgi:pimeloyl-ACP methyl ester carboxylesterase